MDPLTRIPDLRDRMVGPGNAAVDLQILLPKAACGLEADLGQWGTLGSSQSLLHSRREVVIEVRDQPWLDRDDHVFCVNRRGLAGLGVFPFHARAVASAAQAC